MLVEISTKIIIDLVQHIGEDDEARVDQVEYKPHLHWLDGGGRRQTSGDIKIYRGQHHHTSSGEIRVKTKELVKSKCCIHVDGVDQLIFIISWNVVGGLVDHVHQDSWEIDHHEDTEKVPTK